MMKHLQGGVKKGAFDEAAAQAKFEAWKTAKVNVLNGVKSAEEQAKRDNKKARLEAEKEVNAAIAKKVADKKAAEALAKAEAEAAAAAENAEAAEATEAPAEA